MLFRSFQWCPGHSDILGNEWADSEAKEATKLAPSTAPPSISALKEKNTRQTMENWAKFIDRPCASPANKYLAVSGPPSRCPQKLLTMLTSHPCAELTAVAQILCCAGPFGGYWMRMGTEYRHRHGLITQCQWHNHLLLRPRGIPGGHT